MYSETEFSENVCPRRLDNLPAAELVVFRDQNGKDFVSYRLSKKKSQYSYYKKSTKLFWECVVIVVVVVI